MLSRKTRPAGNRTSLRVGDGPDVLAEITTELARRTPAIALITDVPRSERSGLYERLEAHLVHESIRVIGVEDAGSEQIGIRRFCQLLMAASPSDAGTRDSAEHFARTFTSPRAGERGLVLIVENADALSAQTLAFAERLAAASSARPFRIQVLLVGSHSLRISPAGSGPFVVRKLACVAASQGGSTVETSRRWTRRGLTALGCAAALIIVAAVPSGDRDPERVSAGPTLAAEVMPARAAVPTTISEYETIPATERPAEPARAALPATMAEHEAIPTTERPSQSATLQPPVEKAALPVQPEQVGGTGDEPSPVIAMPLPASLHHDVAIPPPHAETYAAQVPVPAPFPAATADQVFPASELLPQPTPEVSPVAGTGTASPFSPVQPEAADPSGAETANVAASAGSPMLSASPAPTAEQVQPQAKLSPAAVAALLARGDKLIAIGDVATARVVYERAAALKSGRGATLTGRTYDARFLRQIGAVGVVPDPEMAAAWYRKGATLGDEAAMPLLGGLEPRASQ